MPYNSPNNAHKSLISHFKVISTSDPQILSVRGLSVRFAGAPTGASVLDLSFSVGKGATLAIVGESGSGKSLTALCLAGLQPLSAIVSGHMTLRDSKGHIRQLEQLNTKDWQQLRGAEVGMVFQEPMSALNPVMSVGEQLRENIQTHHKISHKQSRQLSLDWLAKVRLPDPAKLYHRYPHQLSGGQKQRVMIAMAMCCAPVLLIADEPTTALDATVQREILLLMQELQQDSDSAVIFITHDLGLASEIADDVLVLYRGEAVEYGPATQVLSNPVHPYTQALLACRPGKNSKGKRLPIVADFLDGQPLQDPRLPETVLSMDEVIRVSQLEVGFFAGQRQFPGARKGYIRAVDNVSFHINKGETLGLVGESGCGKSTLSKAIMGLLPVRAGHINFRGEELAGRSHKAWRELRPRLQMVFQDPFASLNPRMRVGDIITEPLKIMGRTRELDKQLRQLLDLVQLPAASGNRYPHQFSGGQRQRIGIARALALQPELLICDESVSALDVSVQAQILNLLKSLQQERGLSYLFISHDLAVVHYISDRIMVMQQGRIVETASAAQLINHPSEAYTRELIAAMPGF